MTCMECEFHLKETLPRSDQFTQFLNCVQWRALGSATLLANMVSRGVRNIPNCVCSHMYVSVCECVCACACARARVCTYHYSGLHRGATTC